jgi:PIN domain nuclease of toxin-antitoxin system
MSAVSLDLIKDAMQRSDLLFSAVSAWEIGLLVAKGHLRLSVPVQTWIDRLGQKPGVRIVPLDAATALNSTMLPEPFVQDPADRFLVASARAFNTALVTRDKRILDYAKAGHVQVVKC